MEAPVTYDIIVVGSGATGVQAAQTLVDSGLRVGMLDVGVRNDMYRDSIPGKDFITIRREDEDQHNYFLGKDLEGISWDDSRVGSQLTPPRAYLTRETNKWLPILSHTFQPMESLAYGGLGGGWGAGCYLFSNAELDKTGLDQNKMRDAYRVVAGRIGVSGANDDGAPYCLGDLDNYQPAVNIEKNLEGIFSSYQRHRDTLNRKGFYVGRSALAVLTKDMNGRKQTSYSDMDFWSDNERSAYRSWITIDELVKRPNFTYHGNCLVMKFREENDKVEVHVKRTDTNEEQVFYCRRLVLSPGVLGTARIVLRAFDYKQDALPVICNPYTYIPCIQLRMLGKAMEQRKTSFSQLVMYLDEHRNNMDVGMAALFSYRSLLLFKLIKETPLNFADGRAIMQYLQSSFTIAGMHHPEEGGAGKFIRLVKDDHSATGDILEGQYVLTPGEELKNLERERKFKWALRQLGCYPLKTIHTPHGASIHYAGTLPFDDNGKPFSLSREGRLAGTRNVYVADGSGFKYLPAKGLTLTLMANAHLVAANTIRSLQ